VNVLRRAAAAVAHSVRQQWRHRFTAVMLMVALAAPIAVAVAVPLYSNGASARLFDEQLGDEGEEPTELAFLLSYNRLSGGSRGWSEVVPADAVFAGQSAPEQLPLERVERFVETEPFALLNADDPDNAERLGSVTLAAVTGFDAHASFVDGRAPTASPTGSGGTDMAIEVAVEAVYADQESIGVGQQLILFDRDAASNDPRRTRTVVVTGIWTDGSDPATLVGADAYRRRFVVPLETITATIDPQRPDLIQNVKWKLTLDRTQLSVDNVAEVLRSSDRLAARAEVLLPGTRMLSNPAGPLRAFQAQEQALRSGLRNFSLPLLMLAGAVGLLVINVAMRSRSAEFAMLRRRGIPRASLLVSEATGAVIVTAGAVLPGIAGGYLIAQIISRTRTFFRLSDATETGPFDLSMSRSAWQSVVIAAVVLLGIQCCAALVATRRSAVLDEGRDTDTSAHPWWQRTYLDVFAIALILVIAWRGVTDGQGRAALLDDPAVILLPASTALAVGLLLLRGVPLLMRAVAAGLERTDNVASLLASRRAGRVAGDVAAPLLLLVITGSLATFTASLAVTLDLQLLDAAHHQVGGAAAFVDEGDEVPDVERTRSSRQNDVEVGPLVTSRIGHPALDDYARVWGVDRAAATIDLDGSAVHEFGEISSLRFVGVEPSAFASMAFWRSDYGETPLGELMDRVAAVPNGILLPTGAARSLDLGDELRIDLQNAAGTASFSGVLVGRFDQFPQWFPDREAPLVVGRAQLVEDLAGSTFDRRVLIDTTQRYGNSARVEADYAAIGSNPRRRIVQVTDVVARAQTAPGRQGVLGMLTVGVGLATLLTLAGFVVTTVLAVRRRSTEIGVLRAMGMTRREVATLALFDLATVMLVGLAAAIGLGLAMSRWFIPVLVDTAPGAAPELLPTVAWGAAIAIASLLLVLLLASALLVASTLRRVRVFESIRLGES